MTFLRLWFAHVRGTVCSGFAGLSLFAALTVRVPLAAAQDCARNNPNDPVVIVDGVRAYGGHNGNSTQSVLDRIDPNIIDKINVIRGPVAAARYGSDAARGVIVITTKDGAKRDTTGLASGDETCQDSTTVKVRPLVKLRPLPEAQARRAVGDSATR